MRTSRLKWHAVSASVALIGVVLLVLFVSPPASRALIGSSPLKTFAFGPVGLTDNQQVTVTFFNAVDREVQAGIALLDMNGNLLAGGKMGAVGPFSATTLELVRAKLPGEGRIAILGVLGIDPKDSGAGGARSAVDPKDQGRPLASMEISDIDTGASVLLADPRPSPVLEGVFF